jgi:hypothetical protein
MPHKFENKWRDCFGVGGKSKETVYFSCELGETCKWILKDSVKLRPDTYLVSQSNSVISSLFSEASELLKCSLFSVQIDNLNLVVETINLRRGQNCESNCHDFESAQSDVIFVSLNTGFIFCLCVTFGLKLQINFILKFSGRVSHLCSYWKCYGLHIL